ncbi:unnamed protein product [Phytophthora fragariaefolia]|uniref:Unnamed protein product n=1 Tax=Phytophthora fragariaefolia TaxID=1490495 RepID=A0A9W6Y7S5_9STRA|nr:unnamed protein product [Phytophthora fragariaefolia]
MRDSRQVKADPPVGSQVAPRERASSGGFSTEASSSSEVTELKDRQTALGYGSTTPEVQQAQQEEHIGEVSDQVLVSAIANLSTAVRRQNPPVQLVGGLTGLVAVQPGGDQLRAHDAAAVVPELESGAALDGGLVLLGRRNRGAAHLRLRGRRDGAAEGDDLHAAAVHSGRRSQCAAAVGDRLGSTDSEDDSKKSKIVAAVFSFQGIGQLLAPLMAYIMLTMNAERTIGWRVLLLVGAFPGLFVLRRAFEVKEDMPPSPITPPIVLKRVDAEVSCRSKLWQKLQDSSTLQRKLFGACASWFLFDLTFYGNIIFTPIILQDTYGLDKHHFADVALCSLVVAAIALPGNLFAVFIVGKISFKTIQIMGFVVMALLFLALGAFYEPLLVHRGLLLGMYALTFFFSNFGPNVGTFCLPAEIFSDDVRVELNGVAAAAGKLGAAFGAASFGIIEARFGVSYLLTLSATVSLLGALVTYKFIPSKHYTPEQVIDR